jgi:hypothetical protein
MIYFGRVFKKKYQIILNDPLLFLSSGQNYLFIFINN